MVVVEGDAGESSGQRSSRNRWSLPLPVFVVSVEVRVEGWIGSVGGVKALVASGGVFEVAKVGTAACEAKGKMRQELRMNIAAKPLQAATAVPVPAPAPVLTTPALDVCKPCTAAEGSSTKWSCRMAPRAREFVIVQVPGHLLMPCSVACAGSGVEVVLVKV